MSGFLTRLAARSLAAASPARDAPAQLLVPRPMSLFEPMGPGTDEVESTPRDDREAPVPRSEEDSEAGREHGDGDEPERAPASPTRSSPATSNLEPIAQKPIAQRPPAHLTHAVPTRAATAATESVERQKAGSRPVADASAAPLVPRAPEAGSGARRVERAPPRASTELGHARETPNAGKVGPPEPATARRPATESPAERPAAAARKAALVPPPRTGSRTAAAPVADRPLPALPGSRDRRSVVADVGSRARAGATPTEPVVHVSIGRVEIRAAPEAPAPRRPAPRAARPPAMSLGDYLTHRDREGRR